MPEFIPTTRLSFHCGVCSRPIFFDNTDCLNCGTQLGYLVQSQELVAIAADDAGRWRIANPSGTASPIFHRCGNFQTAAMCNWMVDDDDVNAGKIWCRSCRLNRTIPDLGNLPYAAYWSRVEMAKRRLVAALLALGLPVLSKVSEDPEKGLAFDFLHPTTQQPAVLTGHEDGVITLNIDEASDARREEIRAAMHEPYRTLLGHLRHEVGHYYWDRLIRDSAFLHEFREIFGDERQDYELALKQHYAAGTTAGWGVSFVSAYASSHPWEDWAETWAHYLHMLAVQDTALSFGLDAEAVELNIDPFQTDGNTAIDPEFLNRLNAFTKLSGVLNEFSRSMGQPDLYPFVLSRPVARKLWFIDRVVKSHSPRAPDRTSAETTAIAKPAVDATA